MKYVASLSTIPSRIDYIHFTLDSLANQTLPFDKIYLCVPYICKRLGTQYVIPESLIARPDVEILRCEDYGPATKVLGLLAANLPEIKPDTKIFFCDDDRIYSPTYCSHMLRASEEHPDSVVCLATTPYWKFFVDGDPSYDITSERDDIVGKYGVRSGWVDVFEGFGGVLVQPRFFDTNVFTIPQEFRVVDDIWLSGHIRSNGWKIWGVCLSCPGTHAANDHDPLASLDGDNERFRCNKQCISYYQTTRNVWIDNIPYEKTYLQRMTEQFRQIPYRPRHKILLRSKSTDLNPNGIQE